MFVIPEKNYSDKNGMNINDESECFRGLIRITQGLLRIHGCQFFLCSSTCCYMWFCTNLRVLTHDFIPMNNSFNFFSALLYFRTYSVCLSKMSWKINRIYFLRLLKATSFELIAAFSIQRFIFTVLKLFCEMFVYFWAESKC